MPLRKLVPGLTLRAEVVMAVCALAFMTLTAWFVTFDVARSQHVFCDLVNTLNTAPKVTPPPKGPAENYDIHVARDIARLKANLGC